MCVMLCVCVCVCVFVCVCVCMYKVILRLSCELPGVLERLKQRKTIKSDVDFMVSFLPTIIVLGGRPMR